ncbi:MAG: hypothetical protein IKH04_01020 [Kiritimatiellae bacterium]|nr:hypothetical protein [Kiritimatiellia bacterium]
MNIEIRPILAAAAIAFATHSSAANVVFAPAPGEDAADALQALIDANPNRTIAIPDGVYLLSHPVSTPADPKLAVSLELADFAVLKAAPGFPARQPLVKLGGTHPANNIRTAGSVYSFSGGVLDGSGVAAGIWIESGRETRVRDVSMKNVCLGLRIKWGANNGSSDCDIRDVNIVGNRAPDSLGVLVEAHDNTFSNMRIADCRVGVRLRRGGGNRFTNVHPLWTNPGDQYDGGIGFDDGTSDNSYVCCYSDHFETGWRFRKSSGRSVMTQCIAFWYAPSPGHRHVAIKADGRFRALCSDMQIGFRGKEATNAILDAGLPGGDGFISDPRVFETLLNDPGDDFRDYLRGRVHGLLPPAPDGPLATASRIPSAADIFGVPPAVAPAAAGLPDALTGEMAPAPACPAPAPASPVPAPACPVPAPEGAGWTFVSVTNGVCDDVCAPPCGDGDLSYHFRCLYDKGGLVVETVVRDDDIATDTSPEGSIYCRSWEDDCAEVFIDGELARLDDSRKDGGRHLWHGGEFVLVANGAAQSRSSAAPDGYIRPERAFGGDLPESNWWTGESFILPGYGHAERFYIPWRSMGHESAPARIGFTISLQDDDGGGGRDHTLYWSGNPAKPHLDERAFGVVSFEQ